MTFLITKTKWMNFYGLCGNRGENFCEKQKLNKCEENLTKILRTKS